MQYEKQILRTLEEMLNTQKEILEKLTKKKNTPTAPKQIKTITHNDIIVDVNKELIFKRKDITETEYDNVLDIAIDWMTNNPAKAKASKYTITTGRLLKFLDNKPDKNKTNNNILRAY